MLPQTSRGHSQEQIKRETRKGYGVFALWFLFGVLDTISKTHNTPCVRHFYKFAMYEDNAHTAVGFPHLSRLPTLGYYSLH